MQSLGFIRLNNKLTEKDFIVAIDPITYVIESLHDEFDHSCEIHYNLPHSETDYVYDCVESISEAIIKAGLVMCWAQDLNGKIVLINPNYILRIESGDDEINPSIVTLTDGTQLIVQDSFDEIFNSSKDNM